MGSGVGQNESSLSDVGSVLGWNKRRGKSSEEPTRRTLYCRSARMAFAAEEEGISALNCELYRVAGDPSWTQRLGGVECLRQSEACLTVRHFDSKLRMSVQFPRDAQLVLGHRARKGRCWEITVEGRLVILDGPRAWIETRHHATTDQRHDRLRSWIGVTNAWKTRAPCTSRAKNNMLYQKTRSTPPQEGRNQ